MLARWSENADAVANAPVITIELAPLPVAPANQADRIAAGSAAEHEAQPEPEPVKAGRKNRDHGGAQAERRRARADAAAKADCKAGGEEAGTESKRALPARPSTAERKADRAAAPAPGASARNSNALPNWKSQLVARLERYKRYPAEAQLARRTRRCPTCLQRRPRRRRASCAHPAQFGLGLLDEATLALVERAAPLPPPPAEIAGAQIAIVVPIRYNHPLIIADRVFLRP